MKRKRPKNEDWTKIEE